MNPLDIPLRDLHLPAPPGWWPLAPGWWVLIGIALGLAGWQAWRAWQRFRRGRPRRIALRQLREAVARHQHDGDTAALVRELSTLLRRAVLAYVPRQQAAGLTGEAWLSWLDRGLGQSLFAKGPGRALASAPYRRPEETRDVDAAALVEAVRTRLATPLPEEEAA